MKNAAKTYLVYAVIAASGMWATTIPAHAANSASDDLYSESIYIHKSSAEVPGSLDSNASPQPDRNLKSSSKKTTDSPADSKNSAPNKKIALRKSTDKPLTR